MANQKIVLAELDLDAKGLLKAAAESKDAVVKLKQEIEACKKAGTDFSKLGSELANVTKAFEAQQQALTQNIQVNQTLATQQNNLINAQQNTVVAANAVTASVKKQGKSFDDYKEQINDALNSVNIFNGGWGALKQRAQESGSWGNLFKSALGGVTEGLKGMGTAIMSNPLGLLLQLVAPIIEQLKNFAPLTNAVERAMAALSPVINLVTAPIRLLAEGLTWVVSGFTSLISSMSDSAAEAANLAKSQQELTTQMALQESANERAKQQTDELIKKSQDHTLSEQERVKAIGDATKVQLQNYNERKAIADKTFAIEEEKLAQAKNLSAQELQILSNGTAAEVHRLMNTKNISKEELEVYEKAKVAKMSIANEAIDIKEKEAEAVKSITDGLIKKSEDQTLSEQERLDALKEAVKIEGELLSKRKKDADDTYDALEKKALSYSGVSKKELEDILATGRSYATKNGVLKRLTQEEINALIAANNEKKRLSRENIELNKTEAAAIKTIKDEERQQKEKDAQKEVADAVNKQQKIAGERAKTLQLEMQLYVQQNENIKRTYEEELSYIKEIEQRKKAIAEESFRATDKKLNDSLSKKLALGDIEKEAAKSKADAEEAHAKKIADDNIAAAKAAHDKVIEANNEILTKNKTLNETIVTQEKTRLENIATAEREFAQKRFENKVISETELNTEITRINTEAIEAKRVLDQELSKTEAAKKVEELEAKKAEKETAFLDNLAIEQEQDDIKRAQELSNVNLTAEEKEEINKRYDDAAVAREKSKNDYIANGRAELYETVKGLFGKESKIGKAIAVAEIANTTVKNASAAFQQAYVYASNPLTAPLAANAAIQGGIIIATGAAQLKKTVGAKFEEGGLVTVGGNRHSAGGTLFTGADGTRFEAEQGELIGVMNRNAAAHFMAFNNAFPAGGTSAPNYFANGGIVSREMAQPGLNIDELAAKISMANAAMPAPVVAVQDIISQGNSYVRVRDAANF